MRPRSLGNDARGGRVQELPQLLVHVLLEGVQKGPLGETPEDVPVFEDRQLMQTGKECLRRKYLHRLRQFWSSEQSGKNKDAATNMLVVALLLYIFGAICWTSSVPRIYLPRHLGGRGLLSLERLHNRVVLATACYMTRSTDPLICFVREYEKAGKGAFLFKAAIRAAEGLSLAIDFTRRCQQSITEFAPAQLKTHIKAAEVEFVLTLHKNKPMHGIFYKHLEEHGLSQQLTFSFLGSSGLKSETEGFIMAYQDGVFNTLVYRSRVMGQHNAALLVLYYHLRHPYGIAESPVLPYAPGALESVVENERYRIYWNYSFPTIELVQANKPDIVLLDHQQKTMFVIDFSASAEVNIVSMEEEKRTKYQELLGRLLRLWPDYAVSLLVIASAKEQKDTLMHLSKIARRGYLSQGVGAVKCFFPNPEAAESFLTHGLSNLGEITYVRWQDLLPSEMGPQLYSELVKMCKCYNPESKLILYVCVCVISETPAAGAVKWERQLVSRCAKMRLSKEEQSYESLETLILTSSPLMGDTFTVRELRTRCVDNLQGHLRIKGVSLKKQHPEIHRQLTAYVEDATVQLPTMTVFPKDSFTGKSFMCVIMLEVNQKSVREVEGTRGSVRTIDVMRDVFGSV
nr:unnamed protein product [Callosobruchus chinensis]